MYKLLFSLLFFLLMLFFFAPTSQAITICTCFPGQTCNYDTAVVRGVQSYDSGGTGYNSSGGNAVYTFCDPNCTTCTVAYNNDYVYPEANNCQLNTVQSSQCNTLCDIQYQKNQLSNDQKLWCDQNCSVSGSGSPFCNWGTLDMTCPVGYACLWQQPYLSTYQTDAQTYLEQWSTCGRGYVNDSSKYCELWGKNGERYNTSCCIPNPYNASNGSTGGGGTTCTTDKSYYECETNPTFGACGYMYNTYGGPTWHLVTHNTCTGWNCNDPATVTSCQSTISGHVFIDNQDGASVHDGIQNNGEVNADANTQTSLEIDGNGTTYVVSTDVNGNYKLAPGGNDLLGGTYTVKVLTPPTNYLVSTGQQTVTLNTANRNPTNVNFGIYPNVYTVSGHVFIDTNGNGKWDVGESAATAAVGSVTVSDGAGQTAAMQADGSYSMPNVVNNKTYIFTDTTSAGYIPSQQISVTVSGANVTGADIGIIPLYGISGEVFKDTYKDFTNGNACYEPGFDTLYTSSPSTIKITDSNGVVVQTITNSNGTFNTNDSSGKPTLPAGTYTVGFSSTLPAGYEIKTPSTYQVTIGPSCATGNPMAYCDSLTSPSPPYPATKPSCDVSGNVKDVSFGLNNENPFFQVFCQDYSNDKGIDDPLPPVGTTCGGVPSGYLSYIQASCNIPGIVYYNGSVNFGQGLPNPNNMLVNRPYSPLNPQVNQMAYSFIEQTLKSKGLSIAGGTVTDLSGTDPATGQPYCKTSTGVAGLANCQLEDNLPSGIYQVGQIDTDPQNEDLTITASPNFNADVNNPKTYIFLVSGNLNIGTNSNSSGIKILVPNGAATAFVAQGGITVNGYVGEQDATSMNPDLEGIFVAGTDFTVDTLATNGAICKLDGTNLDKKLNIVGYVIPGAEGTGSIINRRDLCSFDSSCPVQTTGTGDSGTGNTYLLNISDVLKVRTTFQQEDVPGPITPTP